MNRSIDICKSCPKLKNAKQADVDLFMCELDPHSHQYVENPNICVIFVSASQYENIQYIPASCKRKPEYIIMGQPSI